MAMASTTPLHTIIPKNTPYLPAADAISRATVCNSTRLSFAGSTGVPYSRIQKNKNRSSTVVVAAVGDVSADSTTYLVAGAIGVALIGTAFPIFFSRKDTCPECDGAGFVRKAGATLRANAARKDQAQIVCARCNGLGKLNQIDK
ncbi:Heat shock protein DnaJ, cysteine-rich domain superfamily [Sesbania bispinosa]|nr:Heat shock protein DnaJ, cysteine-rich domain superfamily [Sesbania bispinosa]